MQHKMLYSTLRPAAEGSSLLEMVKGSSSGENPHRAASMELVFERSIREHRERMAAGAKKPKPQPAPPEKPPTTNEKPVKVELELETPKKGQPKGAGGSEYTPSSIFQAIMNSLDLERDSGDAAAPEFGNPFRKFT